MGVTDEQIAAAAKRWADAEDACTCNGNGQCRCDARDRLDELYDLVSGARPAPIDRADPDLARKAH